jgi:hypothetical protein
MRLTGLVVFVAAVFLTFAGSNQLLTDRANDGAPQSSKSAYSSDVANVPSVDTEAAAPASEALETTAEATTSPGKPFRPKPKAAKRNGSEFGVWQNHQGGKWVVETKWDGEKWVTKRVYYPANVNK